jgi:hypothetical protein
MFNRKGKIMKKLYASMAVILFAFAFSSAGVFAQQLEIVDSETKVSGDENSELASHFSVKNKTAGMLNVYAHLGIVELTEGHSILFCWDNCYPPKTDDFTSAGPVQLMSNQATAMTETYAKCYPAGTKGVSKIKMSFYPEGNEANKITLDITYEAGVNGVRESIAREGYELSLPAPNPAIDVAAFDYELPAGASSAEFEVRDLNGNTVYSQRISHSNGRISVPTSTMANGSYICTIKRGGSVYAAVSLVVAK